MTRSERSRLVMKMSWQIFRTSDVTHSEAMKMAHQMVDRKLNPERASRRIKAQVRETFESIPEQVKITSATRVVKLVPVDISKLPTGPMKNSSVYKRGWTTGLTSTGGVGHLHGVGKRPKRESKVFNKLWTQRSRQVSRDEKRSLIPTDMMRLAPVYSGHTTYREYQ